MIDENRQPAIIIFTDGSVQIVSPITVGLAEAGLARAQAAIHSITIGPQNSNSTKQKGQVGDLEAEGHARADD